MKIVKFKKSKVLDDESKCIQVAEIEYDEETKKIINFCISLLFHQNEAVYEIIKYDGSHGNCHVHKYFEKLNINGENCLPSQINPTSIKYYKDDIKLNWKSYIEKYKKKWKV